MHDSLPEDDMRRFDRIPPLAARLFLSAIFLVSGIAKATDFSGAAGHMASHGMRAIPLFLVSATIIELGGGLCLLLGLATRGAALALFFYLVPVTVVFHGFWGFGGAERLPQMVHFMKNLAIMGGLLEVFAFGAGRLSLDERLWRSPPARRLISDGATA